MNPNSRRLVEQLHPGEHRLYNSDLRGVYGLSRLTAKRRHEIARELRRAGLEILSDPATEPLVVRKTAPGRARATAIVRPWWKRPWAMGIGGLVVLVLLIGAFSDDDTATKAADRSPSATTVGETTTTPAEPQPALTLTDAAEKVDQDDYTRALTIATGLSDADEHRIMQKISRRLAYRATEALRHGDRRRARFLLNRADEYSSTPQSTAAWARYDAAQQRAAERRAAARLRRQENAIPASSPVPESLPATESPTPESLPAPDAPSGPSTTNWCGKRDGDGDGLYCE